MREFDESYESYEYEMLLIHAEDDREPTEEELEEMLSANYADPSSPDEEEEEGGEDAPPPEILAGESLYYYMENRYYSD
jgi:hypothetical protein